MDQNGVSPEALRQTQVTVYPALGQSKPVVIPVSDDGHGEADPGLPEQLSRPCYRSGYPGGISVDVSRAYLLGWQRAAASAQLPPPGCGLAGRGLRD